MPSKGSKDADGVKTKQRSKSDKAKRNFELNGKMTAKHVRQAEAKALAPNASGVSLLVRGGGWRSSRRA